MLRIKMYTIVFNIKSYNKYLILFKYFYFLAAMTLSKSLTSVNKATVFSS